MLQPPSVPPLRDTMNPPHPPYQSYPGRGYKADAAPNPLYSMHVNAAFAGAASTSNLDPPSAAISYSPTALYPTHLASHARSSPSLPPKPASLQQQSSAGPSTILPSSLRPGSSSGSKRDSIHGMDGALFFQPGETSPTMHSTAGLRVASDHHMPRRSSSPGLPSRPALPPKPWTESPMDSRDTRPRLPVKSRSLGNSDASLPRTPVPASQSMFTTEDEELSRALRLSMQDQTPQQVREEEEDILARVIAESLASVSLASTPVSPPVTHPVDVGAPAAAAVNVDPAPRLTTYLASFPVRETCAGLGPDPRKSADSSPVSARAGTSPVDDGADGRNAEEARRKQLAADEEFARQLLREEANTLHNAKIGSDSTTPNNNSQPQSPTALLGSPPQYVEATAVPRPAVYHTLSLPEAPSVALQAPHFPVSQSSPDSRPLPHFVHPFASQGSRPSSRAGADFEGAHGNASPAPFVDRVGRSMSAQAALPAPRSLYSTGAEAAPSLPTGTRPSTVIPVSNLADAARLESHEEPLCRTPTGRPRLVIDGLHSNGSSLEGGGGSESGVESVISPLTPDSPEGRDEGRLVTRDDSTQSPMVERDLLQGVSLGFHTPPMSNFYMPMEGVIPNIIQLPFGRCPPLHIQAPTWKHLLKLLARLDSSRIEPTMEALAAYKFEMKLRTVIQFMKLHHSSKDWRVIIYLSIDYPIPPQTLNGHKYTNGDVTVLPYSYTTAPIPALLRAGAGDSQLSKCFTIPAMPSIPFPTLPVSLPDYAMYLHAVLESSRKAASDSTSGFRKLAKMVDTLYPAANLGGLGPEFNGPDRGGVAGIFKRVMGRNKNSQAQRGGNADTFEFITPFRVDEYH